MASGSGPTTAGELLPSAGPPFRGAAPRPDAQFAGRQHGELYRRGPRVGEPLDRHQRRRREPLRPSHGAILGVQHRQRFPAVEQRQMRASRRPRSRMDRHPRRGIELDGRRHAARAPLSGQRLDPDQQQLLRPARRRRRYVVGRHAQRTVVVRHRRGTVLAPPLRRLRAPAGVAADHDALPRFEKPRVDRYRGRALPLAARRAAGDDLRTDAGEGRNFPPPPGYHRDVRHGGLTP